MRTSESSALALSKGSSFFRPASIVFWHADTRLLTSPEAMAAFSSSNKSRTFCQGGRGAKQEKRDRQAEEARGKEEGRGGAAVAS